MQDAMGQGNAVRVSVRLNELAEAVRGREVTLEELARVGDESEDAYFLLALLLSLPFCQPVPMAGLSTPLGVMLAAIGWAMATGRPFRLPARVARVRVPHAFVPFLLRATARMVAWIEAHLARRRVALARSPGWRRLHGLTIFVWGVMLALPLPIPFSNVFSALPIPLLAAALLEDDGVMVLRAYAVSALCAGYWVALIFFGAEIAHAAGLLWDRIGAYWGA